MYKEIISDIIDDMNEVISNEWPDEVFVLHLSCKGLKVYLDKESMKLKVQTNLNIETNDAIFESDTLKSKLGDLAQAITNQINDNIASDEELETLINDAIREKVRNYKGVN